MARDRRQFYAIKAALGVTEKVIIDYYEFEWHLRQYVPTVAEVVDYVNDKYEKEGKHHRTSHTSVNYYMGRAAMRKALKDRGIPFEQHTQTELTSQQLAAALTVMNMVDDRPIPQKLDELGIKPSQYYAWLEDPQFKNFVDSKADKNLQNIRPAAVTEFTRKIHAGDWNAIKFWMETTGELTKNSTPNAEHLLRIFIEIIQRHVSDPATVVAIAQDLKLAAANRTLEVVDPRAIEGSVVDDVAVADARKKLGI